MLVAKKERLFYLDFIRALSIIFIVVYHFNVSLTTRSIGKITVFFNDYPNGNIGTIGVSLFFIISGAALMYSYQNDFSLSKYIKKRFMSIYPMFWTAYAIVFLFYLYKYYTANPFSPPTVEKWTFILSIIGMDGYLVSLIPNYYILGEWFLGCIILLYCCFPVLRILIIKYPKILAVSMIIVYFTFVLTYHSKFNMDFNIITRLPELLFGMYFVRYIKKVRVYQFIAALLISAIMLFKQLDIQYMYKYNLIGISLFMVLAFIGQHINTEMIKRPFIVISKYSFAIFLVQHIIIEQTLERFTGKMITPIETYFLFVVTCIFIAIISRFLFKITNRLTVFGQEWITNELLADNHK